MNLSVFCVLWVFLACVDITVSSAKYELFLSMSVCSVVCLSDSVCMSACLSLCVSPGKCMNTRDAVDGRLAWLGPRNHVLDGGTFGHHLANTTEQSVLGGDAGCRYRFCSNLFIVVNLVVTVTVNAVDRREV